MASAQSAVGFDIGNYATCVALARKGGIDVIMNKESKRETPTVLSFGDKMRVFGSEAQAKKTINFKNTINNLRGLLGRKYQDARVQAELSTIPYSISEGPNGEISVEVSYKGQQKQVSPVQLLAMILVEMKTLALTESPFSTCVIGVPCYYTEQERYAVLDAAKTANVNCVRLLNETTAVALGYGIFKQDIDDNSSLNVAFVDVGHHALQVCIAQVKKTGVKILSHCWDDQLGGKAFDQVIFEHFAQDFQQRYKLDVRSNKKASLKLLDQAEKVKKVLSANAVAPFGMECFMDDVDVKGTLTREEFEKLAEPLLAKVSGPIEKVLKLSECNFADINKVELVGSSSRIPAIQNIVAHIFQQTASKTLNAKECVSKGLAIQCAMLSPQFRVRDYQVIDSFPYSVDLEYEKQGQLQSSVLFGLNCSIPSIKKLTLKRNQPFKVAFKYSKVVLDQLPKGTNEVLAVYEISNFEVPSGQEFAQLSLHFKLDEHGLVSLEYVNNIVSEEYEEKVPVSKDEADKTVKQFKKESTQEGEIKEDKAPEQQQGEGMDVDKDGAENTDAKQNQENQQQQQPMETEQDQNTAPNQEQTTTYKIEKKTRNIKKQIPVKQLYFGGLSKEEVDQLLSEEGEMQANDRYENETADRKNALEAYIYQLRDNLFGKYEQYVKTDDRDKLASELDKLTDWLYEEGEDQGKSVYVEKMNGLLKKGNPIQSRQYEDEHRPTAVQSLIAYCESQKENLKHQKYDHLELEDKQKIYTECENALKWLYEKVGHQQKLSKVDEPILTVKDITKKYEVVERVVTPIFNKPKPKPQQTQQPQQQKEQPKKEQPTKEEQKTEDGKQENQEVDMEDAEANGKPKDDAEMKE